MKFMLFVLPTVPGTLDDRKRLRPIGRDNERYQQMLDELRKLAVFADDAGFISAVREDGTFKDAGDLRTLYEGKGVTPDKDVIAYCRIGERSSHTWFVLRYLLGFPTVSNYDGSWSEWGNSVGVPVEKDVRERAAAGA